jgi:hypothetical protein
VQDLEATVKIVQKIRRAANRPALCLPRHRDDAGLLSLRPLAKRRRIRARIADERVKRVYEKARCAFGRRKAIGEGPCLDASHPCARPGSSDPILNLLPRLLTRNEHAAFTQRIGDPEQ